MRVSTHYYVLCLSERRNELYECFRDDLIAVQNRAFPIEASEIPGASGDNDKDDRLHDLMRVIDHRFAHYYRHDPLQLIVVGEERIRSAFGMVTMHRNAIAGSVEGDHTATSPRDLGQIAWPIVKEAMSGLREMALRDLEIADKASKLVVGLEAVGRHSDVDVGSTLLVEEDFHVIGAMKKTDQELVLLPEADVRDVIDDVVDTVIEKVLEIGGRVIFLSSGSLEKQERIALILSGAGDA